MDYTRKFTVAGRIESLYSSPSDPGRLYLSDLDVELWHKAPVDVFFLGRGTTDAEGRFNVNVAGDYPFIRNGKIDDVFLKIYREGVLLNPDKNATTCCGTGSFNDDFNHDFLT